MRTRLMWMLAAATLAAAPAWAEGPAPASAAKKELVQKVLTLQQPAVEGMARQLIESSLGPMLQQAGVALQQRIAADKREAVANSIKADVKKYVDDAVPLVRERALKLAPSTVGALLEEKFTEDELKQVAAFLESPTYKKYQSMTGDMQRVLGEKLVADTRSTIEPKMQALQKTIGDRLGIAPPKPAAAPAKKK